MTFSPVFSSKINDQHIQKIFVQKKYSKNISCNFCKSGKIKWLTERRFRCKNCWSYGSLTTGTFLEKSKLSLRIWYELIWCFALAHSARKTGRSLGLNYKLCWQSYQTMRKSFV